MTHDVDFHPASPAERRAAFANMHDVWSRGLPLEEHLAWLENSISHARAQYFVGVRSGQVVCALGAYPLQFIVDGAAVTAMAIGSVHTRPDQRGQGLAPALLRWVHERQRATAGVRASVLYSDINPAFYERLGYQHCSSWRMASPGDAQAAPSTGSRRADSPPGEHESAARHSAVDRAAWQLVRFDPAAAGEGDKAIEAMAAMYEADHGARPLSIVRPLEYWRHQLAKQPDDEFYWLTNGDQRHGYVRLMRRGDDLVLADCALLGDRERLEAALYACLLRMVASRQVAGLSGWVPPSPAARAALAIEPRSREIVMVASLDERLVLGEAHLAAAGYFTYIDHV